MALLQLFPLIYYHPGVLCRLHSPDAHLLLVPPVYKGAAAAQSLSYCSAIWSRKILSENMGIPLHAFVSSCRKTIGFFQSLLNGLGFGSAKDTGLASSRGGGLRLLYPTTEKFPLQFPLLLTGGKTSSQVQSTWPHLMGMETGWDPRTMSQNGMSKNMVEHPAGNTETKSFFAHA